MNFVPYDFFAFCHGCSLSWEICGFRERRRVKKRSENNPEKGAHTLRNIFTEYMLRLKRLSPKILHFLMLKLFQKHFAYCERILFI
jgi:hypothetical protein